MVQRPWFDLSGDSEHKNHCWFLQLSANETFSLMYMPDYTDKYRQFASEQITHDFKDAAYNLFFTHLRFLSQARWINHHSQSKMCHHCTLICLIETCTLYLMNPTVETVIALVLLSVCHRLLVLQHKGCTLCSLNSSSIHWPWMMHQLRTGCLDLEERSSSVSCEPLLKLNIITQETVSSCVFKISSWPLASKGHLVLFKLKPWHRRKITVTTFLHRAATSQLSLF